MAIVRTAMALVRTEPKQKGNSSSGRRRWGHTIRTTGDSTTCMETSGSGASIFIIVNWRMTAIHLSPRDCFAFTGVETLAAPLFSAGRLVALEVHFGSESLSKVSGWH